MRHRFLFATDDRIAGHVSKFVLSLEEPMCLVAMMADSDEDLKEYTAKYYYLKFDSEYGRYTAAFMPFSKFEGDPDSILHKAFEWFTEYLDDVEDYLFIDPSPITIDGMEYEIYTRRDEGKISYSCVVNSNAIFFEPKGDGIEPVLEGVPEDQHELLFALARKIESLHL